MANDVRSCICSGVCVCVCIGITDPKFKCLVNITAVTSGLLTKAYDCTTAYKIITNTNDWKDSKNILVQFSGTRTHMHAYPSLPFSLVWSTWCISCNPHRTLGFDLIFDIALRCAHCFCFVILLFCSVLLPRPHPPFPFHVLICLIAKSAHPSIWTIEVERKRNVHKIFSFYCV